MTEQTKQAIDWKDTAYSDELTYEQHQKAQAYDHDKFKLEGKKLTAIKEIQNERSSVYGEFKHQAETVGLIIKALNDCAIYNGNEPTNEQIGSFAYMAIKLARFAVSPYHEDTLVDMESYANLIKKLHLGEE